MMPEKPAGKTGPISVINLFLEEHEQCVYSLKFNMILQEKEVLLGIWNRYLKLRHVPLLPNQ